MQFLSWCYSHIIRATGATALGLIEKSKDSNYAKNESTKELLTEISLYVGTIKRLFELTLTHVEGKIDALEKANKSQRLIDDLKAIAEDCKQMIKRFEDDGDTSLIP